MTTRFARVAAVTVALASVLATVIGSRPALSNLSGKAGHTATQLLAPAGRHAELPAEAFAAAQFQAFRTGQIDPALAPAATLAARAAAGKIRSASGPLGKGWKELGPKPYETSDPTYNDLYGGTDGANWGVVSGRATSVALDPNDRSGKTVWLGTAGGGVWVTHNLGSTWKPVWDDKPSLAIGAIAFDKARPKTLYVGTGEGNLGGGTMFRGTGVYRSTDGGKTFTRVARNVVANVITRIEARAGIVLVGTDRGLWRSADGGTTYSDVRLPTNAAGTAPYNALFGSVVTDIKMHPDRPSEVTAAVGWPRGKLYTPGNGLYRSLKAGAAGSWTRMDVTGLTKGSLTDDPIGRITLQYASGPGQDHDVLWAVVQDAGLINAQLKGDTPKPPVGYATVLNGVYRSGDDGASWSLKATPQSLLVAPGSGIIALSPLYAPGVQAWYNQWLLVSPTNADTVLLGLEEIYQTVGNANGQGPAVWTTVGRYWDTCTSTVNVDCSKVPVGPYAGSTTHPDQHAAALSSDGTNLFAVNDGGMFTQHSDSGSFTNTSWTPANNQLGTTQPYFATMARDGTVYAGFQDNGTAKITPDGYGVAVFGGDGGDVAVDPDNSDHAYEEYVGAVVSLTKDGGKTWTNVTPEVTSPQFIAPFEMDPRNSDHLVLGAQEIVETQRGVDTFCPNDFVATGQHVSADLPSGHSGVCDWKVSYTLGKNPNGNVNYSTTAIDVEGAVVYAGFCGTCGLVSIDPTSDTKVQNGIATNSKKGCVPTTAASDCWHHARARGLPNRFISDVTIDPRDTRTVYLTMGGYSRRWLPPTQRTKNIGRGHVFVSKDSGETFRDISANLPDEPAESIETKNGRLFAATHSGVYTAASPDAAWERLGAGLPNTYVMDINLSPDADKLVVATHGRGVWSYPLGSYGGAVKRPATRVSRRGVSGASAPARTTATVAGEAASTRPVGQRQGGSQIPWAMLGGALVVVAVPVARRRRRIE